MLRRITATLVLLLVVAVCGGLVWFNFFRDQKIAEFFAGMKPPAQVVSTSEVAAKSWSPGLTAIGTARAASGVQLAMETSGTVKEIRFKANDRVALGQLLVQLDDTLERADLIDAEAAVKLNQDAASRSQKLRSRGYDTQASLEQAQAQFDAARSKLARTQAVIELKSLEAPFAGTIGIPQIEVGQYISAGTIVATLQDLDNMTVDFSIPEQFIEQVRRGMTVQLGHAPDDLPIRGTITGVNPRVDPQTRLFAVRADITAGSGREVTPGQFLQVRVELPAEDNVITVPQTAVVTSLYGDYVYEVIGDGDARTLRQVFITTGRRDGSEIEITDGLKPGQVIVNAGQNKLQPGAAVTVDNTINITAPRAGG